MINFIIRKEALEVSRDGRTRLLAIVMLLLGLTGLLAGWANYSDQQRNAMFAQEADQTTFLDQGERNPHSAAHFGRMAYKPASPLAAFDPGAAPFMGQVIWLEAHQRNPAMFRPAADSLELGRLSNFSVAGILTVLLPLLVFLLGYSALAGERERGTLRQTLASGTSTGTLFIAKFIVIAGTGIALATVTIAASAIMALFSPVALSAADTLIRALGLTFFYTLYVLALTGFALLVSALCAQARTALLILLGIWAVSVMVMPRIGAGVAAQAHPISDGARVWAELRSEVSANRVNPDSPEYKAAEQFVISRALGRDVSLAEIATMDVNASGLRLEVTEVLDYAAINNFYANIYEKYAGQRDVRRWFALLSPAIALQHASSAFAGTDFVAHQHFSDIAEVQRNNIVRVMNEDLLLNGAGATTYLAGETFWEEVPDFSYEFPPVSLAWRSAAIDIMLLLLWGALATSLAWNTTRKRLAA
ncbi:MAG: ABC transporter permease subunit [Moraxellaceae bacterium]|nr:ABC transporter permease subunit [Moraxellaceae bacterium]